MFYTAPKPTQALLVTGGFFSRKDVPFRVVVGRGTFYLPFIHRVYRFYIGSRYVRVNVEAQTHQNISVNIEATLAYRVNKDIVSIVEAGSRFLGSNDKAMSDVISSIFSGEVRSLVGARSVEEIITNRDALNMDVLTATGPKLMEMGLKIDNFQINEISDDEGHIKNLSQPELNRVRKIAEVAAAAADTEIEQAQQEAERKKSQYKKDTDLQVSQNTMETAEKRAQAAQSGPIAESSALLELTRKQKELARERADLKEIELIAEVIKPAEADAQRRVIEAKAQTEAQAMYNETLAANERIGLESKMVDIMPEVAGRIATALAGSNITMFNGAEGLTNIVTEVAGTASHVVNALKPAVQEQASHRRSQ